MVHRRLSVGRNTRERKKRRTGVERRWPTAPAPNPIQPARCARYGTPRAHTYARLCARYRTCVHAASWGRRIIRARELPFRSIPPFHSSLASKLSPARSDPHATLRRFYASFRVRVHVHACRRPATNVLQSAGTTDRQALAARNAFSFRRPLWIADRLRSRARTRPGIIGNYRKLILDRGRGVGKGPGGADNAGESGERIICRDGILRKHKRSSLEKLRQRHYFGSRSVQKPLNRFSIKTDAPWLMFAITRYPKECTRLILLIKFY